MPQLLSSRGPIAPLARSVAVGLFLTLCAGAMPGCGTGGGPVASRLQGSAELRGFANAAAADIARTTGANPAEVTALITSQESELRDLTRLRTALPSQQDLPGGSPSRGGPLTLPVSAAPAANAVEVLIDADRIFSGVEDAIRKARRRIQLDLFMLGGKIGTRIASALEERRRAGVDVRVVIDPHFAAMGPASQQAMATGTFLRDHGIPTRTFPLDALFIPDGFVAKASLIDHNKIVIADDVAFIGCANLIDVADSNHDLMFRVRGPIAAEISLWVDLTWAKSNPVKIWQTKGAPPPAELPAATWRPAGALPEGPTSRARLTRTDRTEHSTYDRLLERIKDSRSIVVSTFELDDPVMKSALVGAKGRGAQVRVLLDRHQMDHKYTGKKAPAGIPNWLAVRDLLGAGIPIKWFDPSQPLQEMHLKMALFDDQVAIVGSTNFTTRAFLNYRETGLEIEGGPAVADLVAMFERDWAERSTGITTLTAQQRALAATISFMDQVGVGWW